MNHLKQAYNSLGAHNNARIRDRVTRGMHEFFSTRPVHHEIVKRFVDAINFKTTVQFKAAVEKATGWLKKGVRGRPYVLVVEMGDDHVKSSAWLAHKVEEKVGRPLELISLHENPELIKAKLKKAFARGATTIVHLDDAWYSGQQKGGMIEQLLYHLMEDDFSASKMDVTMLFAAAFGPRVLPAFLKSMQGKRRMHDRRSTATVKFYAAEAMRDPPKNLRKHANFGTRKYTIMPHKLPDSVSFGFDMKPQYGGDSTVYNLHQTLKRSGANILPIYKRHPNAIQAIYTHSQRGPEGPRRYNASRGSISPQRSLRVRTPQPSNYGLRRSTSNSSIQRSTSNYGLRRSTSNYSIQRYGPRAPLRAGPDRRRRVQPIALFSG